MSIFRENKTRLYLSLAHMGGNEQKYVKSAFVSNWIAPLGPNVDGFEKDLQEYTGSQHVAVLSSGTAALHLALILLGVCPGDFVICQSFTFSASANPIAYCGAIPVFIDSEALTWNMDHNLLREAIVSSIKDGKKPKAIIPVHLYGMPAQMDEILSIAEEFDIPVIEDAAEALGSRYKNKACGSFGKMGILSFNGNKIITTSGGGALVSDDPDLIQKARFLATQARDPAPHYQHSYIGYNYRMSNICAGIGRGQMEVLPDRIKKRREINRFYRSILKDVEGITFQSEPDDRFFSNFWLTTILIDKEKTGFDREDLRLAFEADNIESRPLWKPMHLQPVFKDAPAYVNGVSEHLFNTGLCLPSGSSLSREDIHRITDMIFKLRDKKYHTSKLFK